MTPRIEALRTFTITHQQSQYRHTIDWSEEGPLFTPCASRLERACAVLETVLAHEALNPVFLPEERIVFTRTVANLPPRYTDEEMSDMRSKAYFHELGVVFNISQDFGATIAVGLEARREEVVSRLHKAHDEGDPMAVEFCNSVISAIDSIINLTDAYQARAMELGLTDIADVLSRIPRHGAQTFYEALQFLRILHFSLWCEGDYHNGIGRFDQFMYPYLKADLDAGRLDEQSALELVEEFFLSCNRDSDLYIGVQQGDNGQSIMLGGCDEEGNDASNLLTTLALKASCELKIIDPKINLRVSRTTPMEIYRQATELTRVGLGFPQYANDDVVIPGLTALGYDLKDARNYTVAACWEFIIPGVGMDIPNIGAVSFPKIVDTLMREVASGTVEAKDFDQFMAAFRQKLFDEADKIEAGLQVVDMLPCPLSSLLCDGRIEAGRDASEGNKYNNFGIHGTGLAPAVDSLTVIRQLVYEQGRRTMAELVAAVDTDFADAPELLAEVRFQVPKIGNNDDVPDSIGVKVLADFADSWSGRRNCRGGIFRTGTGSAMYYIWHANELPASICGRLKGQPFPANYAPSLDVQVKGPISVIQSFTKPDLKRNINGGPLTIEIHDSAFDHPEGLDKVAQLIKLFVDLGGHQLQINTINRDKLIDAQEHPEQYRHLIVRVWGWSGYFVELDKPYQDQIIRRAEMII